MNNREIKIEEIISNKEYGKQRKDRRKEIINFKKNRRLDIGPVVSLYFESRSTMLYQIQEMGYVEQISNEELQLELDSYNSLVPNGKELIATMMIEIDDPLRRKNFLSRLGGIEEKVKLIIGDAEILAEAEKDLDRTTADGKASAVHFLHFLFTDELINKFKNYSNSLQIVIDHFYYGHLAIVSDEIRKSLSKEFS
tara:strand:+ start:12947 stop:13534 length:588 start_codon:yes stop_codon:yes gene_type:complete